MKYKIVNTDVADSNIRRIILYVLERFGKKVAIDKLDYLEENILSLGDNPYIGVEPQYRVLKKQGYLVLILEKDLVFYKVDEKERIVTVYAVLDQRQDYMDILRGL